MVDWAALGVGVALLPVVGGLIVALYRLGVHQGEDEEFHRDAARRLDRLEHKSGYWRPVDSDDS